MREIKFRGKLRSNNEWIYGDLIHNNEQVLIIPTAEYVEEFGEVQDQNVIPETVGQYIGYKDQDGKEIYDKCKLLVWCLRHNYASTCSYRTLNKNHKFYPLEMEVYWDEKEMRFKLRLTEKGKAEGSKLILPMGKETTDQYMRVPSSFNDMRYWGERYGSMRGYEEPKLVEEE